MAFCKDIKIKLLLVLSIVFSTVLFSALAAKDYKYPYSSFKERDPFRSLVNERGEVLIRKKKNIGDFILQGIMYSSSGSQAVINDEVFTEGGTVGGYKIKKIDAYKVIFEKNGEEFILKWGG